MLTTNPFAEVSRFMPDSFMPAFIVVMIILVIAGTLFDVIHKKSARYFMENMASAKNRGASPISSGQKASIAAKTIAEDVLTSGEFCNPKRRIAHLLTMYGFIIHVVTTAILVFCEVTSQTTAMLWHIGAIMVAVGGYWFWFFIRVDVTAEGNSPFRIVKADMFVLSLLATVTFALLWSWSQSAGAGLYAVILFGLYIISSTILFGGVPWSKFAHMFFKPAAAFEKRLSEADGSRNNLPPPADKPTIFGLGIKREAPKHY